jgi:hypothetical protein
VTVRVSGETGMGKSSLVRAFLDELLLEGGTDILAGRAYERESVPYKAIDGVIDSLSQLLVQLDAEMGERAPRRRIRALARLFPVLDRVSTIDRLSSADRLSAIDALNRWPDESPRAERRRAFRELRACLGILARRRPLVVFIDDIHCGDADSAALIQDVMRQPGAPPILLLMTSREDVAVRPFLAEMAAAWRGELREVHVGRLPPSRALELARTLADPTVPDSERIARAAARDSRGSPLLIQELMRSHRSDPGPEGATIVTGTIESMLARRLDTLAPATRLLAELVAVAGRPLPVSAIAAAAGVAGPLRETFASLEAAGLARLGFRGDRETAEPVHDRLRVGVTTQLPPSLVVEHHGRLADALMATADSDLEARATHLFGAGRTAEGARCAEQAAIQASSKLAFDLAVGLLRMALEATPTNAPEAQALRVRLAQTLVQAGRASAAADEYGRAGRSATGVERIELERAAAEQLLMSGRMDEGRTALRQVLDVMGLSVPQSALGAVLLLVFYQLLLLMRGVRVTGREPKDVPREERTYIDTLRAVATSLSAVDVIMGACMQAKYMLVAMDRGDKVDVLRGLCAQTIQRAIVGRHPGGRETRMIEGAEALASQMGGEVRSYVVQARGLSLYMRGQFLEALEHLDAVGRGVPGVWNTVNARIFALYACIFLGKHREVSRRTPRFLRDVEERGDLYTMVCLRSTAMVDVALSNDDPEDARRQVREAMAKWTQTGFHAQHWYAMWSDVMTDLYEGKGASAYGRLQRDERALRRSLLLRARLVRGMTLYLHGCSAIASIADEPGARAERVAEGRSLANRLSRQGAAWELMLASVVRAAAENAGGDLVRSVESLHEAARHGEAAHMWPQTWAVRYHLGRAIGGEEGRALTVEAERAMRDEGIRSPERMASTLVPGTWG